MHPPVIKILVFTSLVFCNILLGEDLTCLKTEIDGPKESPTWYRQLQTEAVASLKRRTDKVDQLKTPEAIEAYQKHLQQFMLKQLGPMPEKTPLNSQVVGRIPRSGYTIEKILFESQPNHHVTANLYLPNGSGPFPGVIVSSGHSRTGKTAEYNQRFGIALAQCGIAALCYDPIGQGERSQTINPDGKPIHEATTREHLLMASGSILVGRNTASYRVWDAIRALDYLESRSDIDAKRLGMTGCSGGGTLTSYVMALDSRVACAAPACYLTTFSRLIETIGPQDAEQNIFGQLAFGLDQPDYVLLRAPKPTLISSTSDDFFNIQGSWENLRQAKRIFGRLGFPEHVDLVEADGTHGVQPENLAAIAQWMQRWLIGTDRPVPVRPFTQFETLPESELLCTQRGQVLLLEGERSVYDLNKQIADQLAAKRLEAKRTPDELKQIVCKTAGIKLPDASTKVPSNKAGKVTRENYHIDKLVMRPEGRTALPALTFHPKDPSEAAYLYVHDGGKAADGAMGGEIEKLVMQGFVVVSVDLRGQGELSEGKPDNLLGDWRTYFMAYLMGQSMVGSQAEDILTAYQWVANYQSEKPREVHLVAVGSSTSVAAMHAAALASQPFASTTFRNGPTTWKEIASSPENGKWLTSTVHGALQEYDLDDLLKK